MASSVNGDQDQRDNAGLEDMATMTIESLRARLLSERALSKSSRQRADELAKRVLELEEQLRMVSIQRKKAERATADVLAILESNGISEASDAYYSNSDPETISDSKASGGALRRKKSSSNLEVRRSDMEACSSSEIESSPSTGRSLSWKSSKDSEHSHQKTKYVETARRRSSTFTSNGTSFPKRVGKSCRRIRRRESRVVAEKKHDDANMHELQGSTVDTFSKDSLACSSSKQAENHGVNITLEASVSGSPGVKGSNGYYSDGNAKNEDNNGTLQCKAQFRGQFEAEGKAQREWEERVRENNGSMLDSFDPGNRSDVTEERDEMKASDQVNPKVTVSTEWLGSSNSEVVRPSFTKQLEPKVAKNMVGPSHIDGTNSQAQGTSSLVASGSSLFVSACSTSTGTQCQAFSGNLNKTPSPSNHISSISNGSVGKPSVSSKDGESSASKKELALIPEKPVSGLESVLGALQQARLSLNQKLQGIPSSEIGSSGRGTELSVPGIRSEEKIEMPVGFPGLFRLPTDFQSEATARVNHPGSNSAMVLSRDYHDATTDKYPGISYEEPGSSMSPGNLSYGSSPTPYGDLFYGHSPKPFIETRPVSFPRGVSGPHPSEMPFVGRLPGIPASRTVHQFSFDAGLSSSSASNYHHPQTTLGRMHESRTSAMPSGSHAAKPVYENAFDSSASSSGRSSYAELQMNRGLVRSSYVNPHMNRSLVLPPELEDLNDAFYPEMTPQVFKDKFSQHVANSEHGFSFKNDHFRPNAYK